MSKQREIHLDVIRGLAIFLAMGWHLNHGNMTLALSTWWLFPGLTIGWAGVDLFFVLSGFLVGGLVVRETMETKAFNYSRFLARRALRLWPVLYVYLAAELALSERHWYQYLPQVLLHVQNFFETPLHHLWSLAVEEQFYLLVGLLIPLVMRLRLSSTRLIFIALATLIIGDMVGRPLAILMGVDPHSIQIQTQYRLDGLAIGVLLALLYHRYPVIYGSLLERRFLNVTIAILCFISLIWAGSEQLRPTFGYTIAAIGSGCLILSVHQARHPFWQTKLARAIAWLGVYSYPAYVWHNGIGNRITPAVLKQVGLTSPDIVVLFKYAFSAGFAYIIAKLIEQPVMNLRDRLFKDTHTTSRPHHPPTLDQKTDSSARVGTY